MKNTKRKRISTGILKELIKRTRITSEKSNRIRVIDPKDFYYKKTGKIILKGTYYSDLKLDNGTKLRIENIKFQREDIPFIEQVKRDNKISNKDLMKILKDLEKKEEKELQKEVNKKRNILKKFSKNFITQFEVQVNSFYPGDKGTMYYPYEKEEFFKLINRNKKYLNLLYNGDCLVSKIIKSKFIARSDKKGNDHETIKLQLIKILSNAGASLNIKDSKGNDPLYYTKLLKYKKIQLYINEQ